jgi:hypothetical protein
MLPSIKSLFRISTSASTVNSLCFGGSSATSSLVDADQFPFPINPAAVKKFRHNSCPKHLPNPEARVNDVRYFLFILLTSRLNNCAKHYPEWVLETCLTWKGDGLQFLNCTEEQLENLCPMTAAIGFDSHKHKLGTHIPFPARQKIGETIAKFVLEKREGEKRLHMIQRRLQEELNRPKSPWKAPSTSVAAHDLGITQKTMPPSRPLSSSRSVNLPRNRYASTGSSSKSIITVRRHIDISPSISSSVSLSESSTIIPASLNDSPILASPVPFFGPENSAPFCHNDDTVEGSAGLEACDVAGSRRLSFSSTPIAVSTSTFLSPSRLSAPRNDKEHNPSKLRSEPLSTEQIARFTNREPSVNLVSQHTMPLAYRAPNPSVKVKDSGSLLSAQRPDLTQKQTSWSGGSGEKDMIHDSSVDNSSQSSSHPTYPVLRHASSAVTSCSLQDPVSFKTVNYDLYTTCPISRSNTALLSPRGILRAAAADSTGCPSPASSSSEFSTPLASISSNNCVTFAPSRYGERSGSGLLTTALEAHYQNVKQLREAASTRSLHRALTVRSKRSVGMLHVSQGSTHNPYSGQSSSSRGPPPPFIRQESASLQRQLRAYGSGE